MHTAKTQSVRQPQRNRFLLRPIAHHRHYGWAAWIDPVVLRAITISWNNIRIPVRPFHGHPDDKPHPWFANDFGLPRMGCCTKRPQVTQHQGRDESERGHYPHISVSLPRLATTESNERAPDDDRSSCAGLNFRAAVGDARIAVQALGHRQGVLATPRKRGIGEHPWSRCRGVALRPPTKVTRWRCASQNRMAAPFREA